MADLGHTARSSAATLSAIDAMRHAIAEGDLGKTKLSGPDDPTASKTGRNDPTASKTGRNDSD